MKYRAIGRLFNHRGAVATVAYVEVPGVVAALPMLWRYNAGEDDAPCQVGADLWDHAAERS